MKIGRRKLGKMHFLLVSFRFIHVVIIHISHHIVGPSGRLWIFQIYFWEIMQLFFCNFGALKILPSSTWAPWNCNSYSFAIFFFSPTNGKSLTKLNYKTRLVRFRVYDFRYRKSCILCKKSFSLLSFTAIFLDELLRLSCALNWTTELYLSTKKSDTPR